MNGFRIPRKKKVTVEEAGALATMAASQQAFPAVVASKWALRLSIIAILLASLSLLVAVMRW